MRGPFGSAQNCGGAPSPGLLRNPTSPRTRGEVESSKAGKAAVELAAALLNPDDLLHDRAPEKSVV